MTEFGIVCIVLYYTIHIHWRYPKWELEDIPGQGEYGGGGVFIRQNFVVEEKKILKWARRQVIMISSSLSLS